MEVPFALGEGVDGWNTIVFLYRSALKELGTKVDILNDEFQQVHQYNPIEYVKSRIKSPASIVKKLKRYGYESTIDNMVNHINDMAGIRIVCSFTSDIYKLADMIGRQNDLTVLSVKDYIRHPKESGYKSYHMLVTVPIFLSDRVIDTKVEVQIRTIAMDFWASLEHKIYYKFEGNAPEYISRDLRECSGIVSMLDEKMLQLNQAVLETRAAQEEADAAKKAAEEKAAEEEAKAALHVPDDEDDINVALNMPADEKGLAASHVPHDKDVATTSHASSEVSATKKGDATTPKPHITWDDECEGNKSTGKPEAAKIKSILA